MAGKSPRPLRNCLTLLTQSPITHSLLSLSNPTFLSLPVCPIARIYNTSSSNLCQASKARVANEAGVQADGDATNQGTKAAKTRQDDLPPHWFPITAETERNGKRKAKSNSTRRRWDRIVKSRQEAKGRGAPCQNELVGMIEQLKDKLGTKAEPLIVVEIGRRVQTVGFPRTNGQGRRWPALSLHSSDRRRWPAYRFC